ncbi:MAG TPA: hypothetical protein VKP88_08280 [Candidatus Paceibacterota bacterium]|nr:hypothetical protein [Candidatus Paceibacterota bacterium]
MTGMKSFRLLKALAALVTVGILFTALNFHTNVFVSAASIADVSDTLSDSSPGSPSNHTIVFTTPTGIANGETVTIDFSDGPFTGTSSITATDIDVQDGATDLSVGATCGGTDEIGASFTGSVLTIEFCSGNGAAIAANGSTTIEIGNHADFGGTGSNRLVNPNGTGSYDIVIDGTQTDSGTAIVVIIATVTVTATVDTTFTFEVLGVGPGEVVNGTSTTGSSTPTAIAFGTLTQGVASTTAQELRVITNASQGYVVTVAQDGEFIASNNATIDSFTNGSYVTNPTAWQSPSAVPGSPNTFGHWGLTSDDATTTRSVEFSNDSWVAASTTPVIVMSHTGPTDGTGTGEGTTRVGYRVEVSALQEAAADYTTSLRYVATPIF